MDGESHATLRPGNDAPVRTCCAARVDLHVPRTLDGDACEQDEQECGGADDGEDGDEDVVGVLVEISVRARYQTQNEETDRDSDEKGPDGVEDLDHGSRKADIGNLVRLQVLDV